MVGKLTPNNMTSASRIPTLLGLSPWSTPNEMLAEMRALDAGTPKPSLFNGNEATTWGDTLEPVILKQACQRLGIIEADIDLNEPFFHPSLPLAASLDGMGKANAAWETDTRAGIYCPDGAVVADGWGCLEAKLTSARPEDQPPAHRGLWQLQAQMMCAGYNWGCIATLYRGIELRLFMYQANPVMQRRIAEAIEDFETRRVTGDKYPVLTSDDGNHAFDHVDDGAPPIDMSTIQGGQQMMLNLSDAKERKRQAEWDIDQIEASIKEVMGEHEQAVTEIAGKKYIVKWPMRKTRAQPERVTPAKPAAVMRQKTLTLKVIEGD